MVDLIAFSLSLVIVGAIFYLATQSKMLRRPLCLIGLGVVVAISLHSLAEYLQFLDLIPIDLLIIIMPIFISIGCIAIVLGALSLRWRIMIPLKEIMRQLTQRDDKAFMPTDVNDINTNSELYVLYQTIVTQTNKLIGAHEQLKQINREQLEAERNKAVRRHTELVQAVDQLVFLLIQVSSGQFNITFPEGLIEGPLKNVVITVKSMLTKLAATTISKNWFEVMVSSIGDAVISTDEKSTVTFMNKEAEKLTGWTRDEVLNKKNISDIFCIINAKTREVADNPVERVMREETVVGLINHTFLIRRDGHEFPIDDSGAPIRNNKGEIIGAVLIFRDVSERYKKEQLLIKTEMELRQGKEFLQKVIDSVADTLVVRTPDYQIIMSNREYQNNYGEPDPKSDHMYCCQLSHARETPCDGPHDVCSLRECIETKQIMRAVRTHFDQNNNCKIIELLTVPMLNEDGEVVQIIETGHDITELKQTEELLRIRSTELSQVNKALKEEQSQLIQAQKLASIGQLAAGIAHEINTPIQYVGDNTHFLQDSFKKILSFSQKTKILVEAVAENKVTNDLLHEVQEVYLKSDMDYLCEEIPNAISQSLEGNNRVAEIVLAMKEFAHPGGQEKTPVDLNRAIQTTITVARNEWKYVAEMETDFVPTLPLVPCMPGEINQVFLNLIVNAAHAIQEKVGDGSKDKIHIQTKNDEDWVEIRVSDTGNGIPEAVKNRIFDPFFTTKEVGKGSGQGLALVRSVIVDKHQGMIDFETTLGEGTTFIVKLPLQQALR